MEQENEDQKQFFKDLGATAEQTVQEVRGFEENYYSLVQRTMIALPLAADFNKKIQSYIEQNFAAAFAFARDSDYNQKYLQSIAAQVTDFVETYANMGSGAIGARSHISLE